MASVSTSPRSGRFPPDARRQADLSVGARRVILGVCLFLAVSMPLCLYLGVRGFAPVAGLAGLICLPLIRPTAQDVIGALILLAVVIWAAISIAWSPADNLRTFASAKAFSHFTIGHMVFLLPFCFALITGLRRLDAGSAQKALSWIAYGVLAATPVVIADALCGIKLYPVILTATHQHVRLDRLIADLAQAAYVVAVVAWPLAVVLKRQRQQVLALGLFAFVPISMVVLRGVAPTLALGLGLGSFLLVFRLGARGVAILALLTATYLLAVPLVMLSVDHLHLFAQFRTTLPPSWSDRLRIWSFVAEQLAKTFPRGAGLDASRTFPGVIPLHPHSAPLQVWYELGLPGAVIQIVFWLWLWRRIGDCARLDRLYGAAIAATATAYFTINAVSFGQFQAWWLAVGGLAMALCVLLGKAVIAPKETVRGPSRGCSS